MTSASRPEPSILPRVLCVGDMTLDILAQAMPSLPRPGEVLFSDRIVACPGGNALNTAVALQRLGEPASFVGSVGDDAFGQLLLGELKNLGFDLRGIRRGSGRPTPTTLIYRAEEEDRRFIATHGAGEDFTGENVPTELIPEGGVVLAAGFLKLRAWKEEALIELFHRARQRKCKTVLNVCIPHELGPGAKRCLRILPLVDVFVPNEDEARLLTGEEGPPAQVRVLRGSGAGTVVITRGAKGLYAEDARSTVEMDAFSVPLVDPTGCGDCFTAGLIAALLRRWEMAPMLQFASAVGALAATALGSTTGVPSFAEVEDFLKRSQRVTNSGWKIPPPCGPKSPCIGMTTN